MDKNKKLVKQLHFIPPPYGGVSIYVKRLNERLNKDGYVSGAYYFAGKVDESIEKSPLYDSFQWLSTKRFIPRFIKLIKETKQYKIVHSHFGLESTIFLWTLSFFLRKKIVVTVHNSWSENFYFSTNSINRFFLKQLAKTDITWIAVSEEARAQMQKLPVKFKNIRVIPAFIPNDSNYIEEDILSQSLIKFLNNKNILIVFYGHSFMKNGGHDVYGYNVAIEMFDELLKKYNNKLSLVMCIGEDDQVEINKLRNLAEEKGINQSIYWQIGAIKEMNALWKYTDIYIRPTSSDGDSVAVREALNLGIRVVASDVCIRPQGTILYHFNDISDFTNKVIECLNLEIEAPQQKDFYKEMLNVYKSINTSYLFE